MAAMRKRLALLVLLYFCQGLPGGFLAEALPVILLQQGIDLAKVGLVGLLVAAVDAQAAVGAAGRSLRLGAHRPAQDLDDPRDGRDDARARS